MQGRSDKGRSGHARPKRADAVRNRQRVLDAARAVFAESGIDSCMDEVAERAGVGKATIYRSFPTKSHLIAGVAVDRLVRLERLATEALEDEDAGAAFRRVLVTIAETQADDQVMLDALRLSTTVPELAQARRATAAALERLMRRAKSQGRLRRDAAAEDVRILLAGLTHTLSDEQQHDRKLWRRYANLVADALGAPRGDLPLSGAGPAGAWST
jgi:AcrR family transcriptional regulator